MSSASLRKENAALELKIKELILDIQSKENMLSIQKQINEVSSCVYLQGTLLSIISSL